MFHLSGDNSRDRYVKDRERRNGNVTVVPIFWLNLKPPTIESVGVCAFSMLNL